MRGLRHEERGGAAGVRRRGGSRCSPVETQGMDRRASSRRVPRVPTTTQNTHSAGRTGGSRKEGEAFQSSRELRFIRGRPLFSPGRFPDFPAAVSRASLRSSNDVHAPCFWV